MIRRIGLFGVLLVTSAVALYYAPERTVSVAETATTIGLRLFEFARTKFAGSTHLSESMAGVLLLSVVVGLSLSAVLPD